MQSKPRRPEIRRGWRVRLSALVLAAFLVVGAAAPAMADTYESDHSGHPLRMLAYLTHPIGAFFDYVFLRPGHWLVSQEPMRTIFGHKDDI